MGLIKKYAILRSRVRALLLSRIHGKRFDIHLNQGPWGSNVKINAEKDGSVRIGQYCSFGDNVRMDCSCGAVLSLGDRVFLNNGTYISAREGIRIGDKTMLGPNVCVFDHDHDYRDGLKSFKSREIVIGSFVWIGANAVILRGAKIGDHAVIGAGCVVKGDIPAYSVVTASDELKIQQYKPE